MVKYNTQNRVLTFDLRHHETYTDTRMVAIGKKKYAKSKT